MNLSIITALKQIIRIADAVFDYHHVHQVIERNYRISFTSQVNRNDVKYNLNKIVPKLGFKPTATLFVADYFECRSLLMYNSAVFMTVTLIFIFVLT